MNLQKSMMALLLLCSLAGSANAQLQPTPYFGFGMGLDYGGFGLKADLPLSRYFSIIGGAGYNLLDPAYNVGMSLRPTPGKKAQMVVMGMYGYNAVIKFANSRTASKSYYGFTAGAGLDILTGKNNNKFTLGLLVPIRNKEFNDYYDELKGRGYEFKPGKSPVTFSMGFHFRLKKTTDG